MASTSIYICMYVRMYVLYTYVCVCIGAVNHWYGFYDQSLVVVCDIVMISIVSYPFQTSSVVE